MALNGLRRLSLWVSYLLILSLFSTYDTRIIPRYHPAVRSTIKIDSFESHTGKNDNNYSASNNQRHKLEDTLKRPSKNKDEYFNQLDPLEIEFKPLKKASRKKKVVRKLMLRAYNTFQKSTEGSEIMDSKEQAKPQPSIDVQNRRAMLLNLDRSDESKLSLQANEKLPSMKDVDPDIINLLIKHRRSDFAKLLKKPKTANELAEDSESVILRNIELDTAQPTAELLSGVRQSTGFFCDYNVRNYDTFKDYQNALALYDKLKICYADIKDRVDKDSKSKIEATPECTNLFYKLALIIDNFDKFSRFLIYGQIITDNNAAKWIFNNQNFVSTGKIEKEKFYIRPQAFLETLYANLNSFDLITFKDMYVSEAILVGNLFNQKTGTKIDMEVIVNMSDVIENEFVPSLFFQVQRYSNFLFDLTNFLEDQHNEESFLIKNRKFKSIISSDGLWEVTYNYLMNYSYWFTINISQYFEQMDEYDMARYVVWMGFHNKKTNQFRSANRGCKFFSAFNFEPSCDNLIDDPAIVYADREGIDVKETTVDLLFDQLNEITGPRFLQSNHNNAEIVAF